MAFSFIISFTFYKIVTFLHLNKKNVSPKVIITFKETFLMINNAQTMISNVS